ncbi:hypothetical protein [Planomonospora parontospora]|uniref:hypothetical protein n=1 Tax=Planomonospora parontospora TaxID=58119 RepID=UPI00166FC6C6|nr:hypothetical protein [Planomonospora parontospora]GGL55153.1 hypothetical protein GCM10014719_65550 [Planomonospora parontospora subsp. antibiotica]GII19781.1 hypothetical protein Ppa05_65070 [Planomonospora parontospora subsp. antibiotica]
MDRAGPQTATLPDTAVHAVLAAIGWGPGATTWVTADGRWTNGVLGGSWRKQSAAYIGEGTRQAARRARLAALVEDLLQLRAQLAELDEQRQALTARQGRLTDEHRVLPSDAPLREAHVRLATEHGRRRELECAHAASQTQAARQGALAQASEFAADVGLPAARADLAQTASAVADYRLALAGLWPAADALRAARRVVDEELTLARDRHAEVAQAAVLARQRAQAAAETFRALAQSAGAAVEELHRRLDEVQQALTTRDAAECATRERERTALVELGRAEGARDALREEITEAGRHRDAAVA